MSEDQKTRLAPVVVSRIRVNSDIVTPAANASAMATAEAIELHDSRVGQIIAALEAAGLSVTLDDPVVTRRHVPIEAAPAAQPAKGPGGDGSDG